MSLSQMDWFLLCFYYSASDENVPGWFQISLWQSWSSALESESDVSIVSVESGAAGLYHRSFSEASLIWSEHADTQASSTGFYCASIVSNQHVTCMFHWFLLCFYCGSDQHGTGPLNCFSFYCLRPVRLGFLFFLWCVRPTCFCWVSV